MRTTESPSARRLPEASLDSACWSAVGVGSSLAGRHSPVDSSKTYSSGVLGIGGGAPGELGFWGVGGVWARGERASVFFCSVVELLLNFATSKFITLVAKLEARALHRLSAAEEVDEAWRRWKENPSAEAEAAYEAAFLRWKGLGTGRGVGRPASTDQEPLSSAERTKAVRLRQQESAAKWERVAPLIQRLRRSFEENELGSPTATTLLQTLVKATKMSLENINVIHAQPDGDFVVLHGWHLAQQVLGFVAVRHLDNYFPARGRLSGKQANLVVDRNIRVFADIMSNKYERGEHRPYSRSGVTLPCVDITLDDMRKASEPMTDSVLDLQPTWQ